MCVCMCRLRRHALIARTCWMAGVTCKCAPHKDINEQRAVCMFFFVVGWFVVGWLVGCYEFLRYIWNGDG